MNRVGLLLLVLAAAASAASDGAAQTLRTIDSGTRVRVRIENSPRSIVAVIHQVRPDTLVLARPNRAVESLLPLPLEEIGSIEVSAGRHRLTLIGAAAGALLGLTVTAGYNSIVQSQCTLSCPDPVSTGIGAALGGLTLGIGFHFVRIERWHPIVLPRRSR